MKYILDLMNECILVYVKYDTDFYKTKVIEYRISFNIDYEIIDAGFWELSENSRMNVYRMNPNSFWPNSVEDIETLDDFPEGSIDLIDDEYDSIKELIMEFSLQPFMPEGYTTDKVLDIDSMLDYGLDIYVFMGLNLNYDNKEYPYPIITVPENLYKPETESDANDYIKRKVKDKLIGILDVDIDLIESSYEFYGTEYKDEDVKNIKKIEETIKDIEKCLYDMKERISKVYVNYGIKEQK